MDLRQTSSWAKYLSSINWTIEKIGPVQIFIKKLPFLHCSVIKIQHPNNPLPLKEIDNIAKIYNALFILIEPNFKDFNENVLDKYGFKKSKMLQTHTATIQLDLNLSEDLLFSSFSENARRNIKKAQKNNLTIKTVSLKEGGEKEFKKFFRLHDNLTKIKKFWAPGFSEFSKKMVAFKNKSYLLFAYTPNSKEPITALWVGINDQTIHYMHTGIIDEGYNLFANYLLVWEACKLGKKLKLKTFDFEGIYDPRFPWERKRWKNFTEFKKRFHGKTIFFPQPRIKFYHPVFKLIYLCSTIFYR